MNVLSPEFNAIEYFSWTGPLRPGGHRQLAKPINAELRRVSKQVPIFRQERGRLCKNSAVNFSGGILAKWLLNDQKIVAEHVPDNEYVRVKPALEILSGAQLVRYEPETGTYKDLDITDSQILVKYDCAAIAGLILQGPYAGTLVEPLSTDKTRYFSSGRACLNRVINDGPVVDFLAPYNLKIMYYLDIDKILAVEPLDLKYEFEIGEQFYSLWRMIALAMSHAPELETAAGYSNVKLSVLPVLYYLLHQVKNELGITRIDKFQATRKKIEPFRF